ncbi:MAG: InlB B-repeat-containing protein, partial [Oscillospiraceae bacterium]|nr:InlB B-repeat-containing protein [Oscillospiraceae bacterium]
GGSNAPADQTKEYDVNIQISEQAPTRAGYNFMGWAVSAAAAAQGTVAYAPGDWYDGNADLSLYAVWMANRWLGETEMFSFANTASAFGNSYAVSDADFRKLTDYVYSGFANDTATAENKVNAMQALRGSDWLGSCYGMAAAAILDKQGGIDFEQNFDRDAQTLYEVDRPVDNEQVRSAINYYMLAQKSGLIQLKGAKNGDPTWNRILQELVNATRRGDLIFFCYTFAGMDLSDWTDTDLGHAIVIRGYEWDAANGSHNLIAYDNRYPDQECIVRIDGGCTYGYLQYTDSNGAVNRPAAHSTAKTVTLTATISKGGQSTTKTFTVTVQPQECNNIHIWGKHTHYASNFWNWFLCIVCFGWIWMLWW